MKNVLHILFLLGSELKTAKCALLDGSAFMHVGSLGGLGWSGQTGGSDAG